MTLHIKQKQIARLIVLFTISNTLQLQGLDEFRQNTLLKLVPEHIICGLIVIHLVVSFHLTSVLLGFLSLWPQHNELSTQP